LSNYLELIKGKNMTIDKPTDPSIEDGVSKLLYDYYLMEDIL
jgi:hypothetical protein